MEAYIWIALFVVLLIVEGLTMGLTTIWFAGGALVAFILALFNVNIYVQIGAFLVVSLALLFGTRPWAKKYLSGKRYGTNYDGVIGKVAKVVERVDNYNATGLVAVNGVEWTARAENDNETFEPGTLVKVNNINGVKLIITKYFEEQ
ncbi:MAG: NfeD family protein [Lachnospiraceae bacterium]|nr:NfeD family protein [Lachnospiraceae bacterium]